MRKLVLTLLFAALIILGLTAVTNTALALSVTVSRTIDKSVIKPGEEFTVKLTYYPSSDVLGLVITEKIPIGFEVVSANPPYKLYKKDEGIIKWLFYGLKVESGEITYKVRVPKDVDLGTYRIEGLWEVASLTETISGTISSTTFEVKKAPSTISISVSPKQVYVDESVSVTGKIEPAHVNVKVTLKYMVNGKVKATKNLVTASDGSFTDVFTPSIGGAWSVVASWLGDYDHKGSTSKEAAFTVKKFSSTLTISVEAKEVNVGKELKITGKLQPPIANAKITLTYVKAGEVKITHTAITKADGTFTDTVIPDAGGIWKVKASWEGNEKYEASESGEVSFEAIEKRCIIATATYGSELAPQVQYLRGFREAIVYKTYAGSQFMKLFNAFYYSWSPYVAGLIWNYPTLKPIMQALLNPLLTILHIATITYQAFSFNSEAGIVLAGLVVCSLVGLVYLTPPVTVTLLTLKRRRKILPKTCQLKPLLALWVTSLALTILGEVTGIATLTMIATGILTITTTILVAGVTSLKIAHLKLKQLFC